jgi:cytochrome c biogenesis protein CcmG, thiol:disulfide interchange protein DsbE
MRYLLPIFLLICLLFFLWQGLAKDPAQIPSPLINKPIPRFEAPSLFDEKKKLTEKIFSDHFSLLVVWSSWCSSCLLEHNFLLGLEKKSHLKIIALNYRDNIQAAKQWLKQHGNPYRSVIFDPNGFLGIELGVYGVPESFLIDGKGIIRYKHIGPLTQSSWTAEIMPWLNQRKGKEAF